MNEPTLLTELHEGVLTLSLNRPDKLNAINNPLALGLLGALNQGAADKGVRAIRLRGRGMSFRAGRDVGAPPTERDLELVQSVADAMVRNPKPILAQVHGWTVGAGLEWMMCADVVVAGESTRFKLPEAALGVFVTGGLTATLPASAGWARAKALAMLGEAFSARQAVDWGLIHKAVDDADLDTAGRQTAQTLAALKPEVAWQFKRVFNGIGLQAFDLAIQEENKVQRLLGGASPSAPR